MFFFILSYNGELPGLTVFLLSSPDRNDRIVRPSRTPQRPHNNTHSLLMMHEQAETESISPIRLGTMSFVCVSFCECVRFEMFG